MAVEQPAWGQVQVSEALRSRASEHLERAAARLRDLEGRYRRKYLPPRTREHPDPAPQHLAAARQFRAVADRILEIDTRLRALLYLPTTRSGCASAASSRRCSALLTPFGRAPTSIH